MCCQAGKLSQDKKKKLEKELQEAVAMFLKAPQHLRKVKKFLRLSL
jgi:hypothetical protein